MIIKVMTLKERAMKWLVQTNPSLTWITIAHICSSSSSQCTHRVYLLHTEYGVYLLPPPPRDQWLSTVPTASITHDETDDYEYCPIERSVRTSWPEGIGPFFKTSSLDRTVTPPYSRAQKRIYEKSNAVNDRSRSTRTSTRTKPDNHTSTLKIRGNFSIGIRLFTRIQANSGPNRIPGKPSVRN
jgi:hypothetical protein